MVNLTESELELLIEALYLLGDDPKTEKDRLKEIRDLRTKLIRS